MGRLPALLASCLFLAAACGLQSAGELEPDDGGTPDAVGDGADVRPDDGSDAPDRVPDDAADDDGDASDGAEADDGGPPDWEPPDDGAGEESTGDEPDAEPPEDAPGEAEAADEVEAGYCGDGFADPGEECDGDDVRGATCEGLGYGGGTIACDGACFLDESGCTPACSDECSSAGDTTCSGTSEMICTLGGDGCFDWLPGRDCMAASQVCDDSTGAAVCIGGTGDTCAAPQVVGTLPLTVAGGNITTTYRNDHGFIGPGCTVALGVEAVFVRYMTAGETIRVRETGNVNVVLRVLSTCSGLAACLADRDDPEDPGLTFTAPADGNYYVVVEAVLATPASVGYSITIDRPPPGNTCSDPQVLTALPATRAGGSMPSDFTNDHDFTGPGCTPASGVEAIFARDMAAGETIRVRESGNINAVLRVLSTCDGTAACLANRDDPEDPGLTFTAPSAGLYYIVVESYLASPASVGYSIAIDDPPPGNLCTDPIVVASLPATRAGGNMPSDFTNDHDFTGPGCLAAAGVEMVFARDMAAGETIRIRDAGNINAVLRVLSTCDGAAACLASRDDPEDPGLSFTAPWAGRYYFVAESYLASPASVGYSVTVDDPPPGNLCTDPIVVASLPVRVNGGNITAAFTDDVRFTGPSCTSADGVDVFFVRAMLAGEQVRVSESGSLNAVIRAMGACTPLSTCLLSQDEPESPGPLFTAPADGIYHFVVESILAAPASRGYDITVSAP